MFKWTRSPIAWPKPTNAFAMNTVILFANPSWMSASPYLLTHLLSIKGFEHGNPFIGDFAQTDEEIEAYQRAYVKTPEIGENGEYILEDGKTLRQYSLLNNAQLRGALRARGIPGIGKKEKMIKCLMADDSTHQPGCFESGFEALYIHWDGSQMGSQKQKAFSSTWQIQGYRHEVGDMGAWDEDSEEEWPSLEDIEDQEYQEPQEEEA